MQFFTLDSHDTKLKSPNTYWQTARPKNHLQCGSRGPHPKHSGLKYHHLYNIFIIIIIIIWFGWFCTEYLRNVPISYCCPDVMVGIVWSKVSGWAWGWPLKKYSFETSWQASDHGQEHSMTMVMANTIGPELWHAECKISVFIYLRITNKMCTFSH
jgi:hypothetical protein